MTLVGPTLPSSTDCFPLSLTKKRLQGSGHVGEGTEHIAAAAGRPGRIRGDMLIM